MRIYYYKSPEGNFGDDLNTWLWKEFLCNFDSEATSDTLFVGIGTILDRNIPLAERTIVFGAGVGYHPLPDHDIVSNWDIICVRGPLSAEILGLPVNKAVTDPAILVAALPENFPIPENERHGVVFMPHIDTLLTGSWQAVSIKANVLFIDPRDDSRKTIEIIRKSKLVLAGAMHAAIVADALRVPWIPISSSAETNSFKWEDWALSLNVPFNPIQIPKSTYLDYFKEITLYAFGIRFRFSCQLGNKAILENAHKIFRKKRSKKFQIFEQFKSSLFNKVVKIVRANTVLSRMFCGKNTKHVIVAANALKKAAEMPGYLSDYKIHRNRLSELLRRLNTLSQNKLSSPPALPEVLTEGSHILPFASDL